MLHVKKIFLYKNISVNVISYEPLLLLLLPAVRHSYGFIVFKKNINNIRFYRKSMYRIMQCYKL